MGQTVARRGRAVVRPTLGAIESGRATQADPGANQFEVVVLWMDAEQALHDE